MTVNENEDIVCCDVDLTLVSPVQEINMYDILITNPYSGTTKYYKVHHQHIELIKQYKGRGCFVRVWSHGGAKWAETVVKTLGLESYVDSVETKPLKLIDDMPAEKIFKNVIYLSEDCEETK